jgi:molybdopterin converting factor small subunit
MKIYVKLFANLVQKVTKNCKAPNIQGMRAGALIEIELPKDSTVVDLLTFLTLEKDRAIIAYVDGRLQNSDYHLGEGDQVGIFPPLGGG